ncbi:MAG: class B sortase [Oscillospiraceae bacterium]|nr:class B sortase [Oscillospiraceae bacterium]
MKGRKRVFFAIPIILAGLAVMMFAGLRVIETKQLYREGNASYESIGNSVRKFSEFGAALSDAEWRGEQSAALPDAGWREGQTAALRVVDVHGESDEAERVYDIYIPGVEIDFAALREINKDAAAWLYSPGTVIDYPVLESDNYSYYLNHLPDGTVNANGSLFIDYNSEPDFSGPLTVVYGHHMKSGSMFGSLVEYKRQEYFDEHPFMYLYAEHGDYRIDVMYGVVIGAGQWKERAFMYAENIDAFVEYAEANSTFVSGVVFEEGDRLVALSTCSYEFDDARYVVLGVLKKGR